MNLLLDYKNKILKLLQSLAKDKIIVLPINFSNFSVELPPKSVEADISCNVLMILAKINNTSPLKLGENLKKVMLKNFDEIDKIHITKKGFLNIVLKNKFWSSYLFEVVKNKLSYGSNKKTSKNYNVEFVSANPTGPLHVGHCRGAILGDVISNLLLFNGNTVTKEYYVNDYGSQIKNFVLSVYYRIIELTDKKSFPNEKDLYPGDYIIDIAKKIIDKKIIKDYSNLQNIYSILCKESLNQSMSIIKENLNILGIKHDSFVYESDLVKNNAVLKTINELKKNKFVYEGKLKAPKGEIDKNWKEREQLLFNSTNFGDDVDRAIQKEDGSWTYFASDIAYHANKVERKYDALINILGADHAGYIKRITAATKAVSKNKIDLICKVSQLVKLFKEGKPFKMSKRKGDYITVDDLIKEVGKDATRFMMLSRSNEVELDFDLEKVKEKSKDNPVYYVQYAFARINSIFKVANLNINDNLVVSKNDSLNKYEIEMLKKVSEWPRCVEISLQKHEPHRIPFFLYELSTLFHSYWNLGRDNKEFRFTGDKKHQSNLRFVFLQSLSIVIKNGMNILGVSTPESM